MLGFLYALIPVVAWGIWLTPSQNVLFRNQQIKIFYVAAANLVLATVVLLFQGAVVWTPLTFWLPFVGGLVWSVSNDRHSEYSHCAAAPFFEGETVW